LLPPEVLQGVIEAFSHSLQPVFLIAVPFGIVAFALAWALKEVPMRTREREDSLKSEAPTEVSV
jgi:hypothetical protein